MSRIIQPDSVGKDRTRLTRSIALAVRELARQPDTGPAARDLAAFMALALQAVADGIDSSVAAWEKRGYWVKADRFRMEWGWAADFATRLRAALRADDWKTIAELAAQTAQKLAKVQIPERHRLGTPWVGAFERLNADR
jgi:hypothetical protein